MLVSLHQVEYALRYCPRTIALKAGEIAFSPFAKASDLPPDVTPNEIAAWAVVSRVLLNLDETITKE